MQIEFLKEIKEYLFMRYTSEFINGYIDTYTKDGETYDKDFINKEIELMETDE